MAELTPTEILELPKSIRRQKCLHEMREIIEKIGTYTVNKSVLARKYGFHWETIDSWFSKVLSSIPPERIEIIANKSEKAIDKALNQCEMIIARPDLNTRDKIAAINALNDTLKTQIQLLEAYGRKEKVPDKIEIKEAKIVKIEAIIKKLENENRRILTAEDFALEQE
jgi:hypothetical protein